jgi:hypothetical protein
LHVLSTLCKAQSNERLFEFIDTDITYMATLVGIGRRLIVTGTVAVERFEVFSQFLAILLTKVDVSTLAVLDQPSALQKFGPEISIVLGCFVWFHNMFLFDCH